MIDPKTLKTQLDLVAVVRALGVPLRRTGVNYFASCPFHSESTPSLSVNPRAQLWRCFGCNAAGDVFTFVQRYEHIGFGAALRRLADLLATTPAVRRA